VGLYIEVFYAIIPTLFLCFLLIFFPYILFHFTLVPDMSWTSLVSTPLCKFVCTIMCVCVQ